MKSDLVRGLLVCVAGMQTFLVFILLFPHFAALLVGKAGYGDLPAMDHSINSGALMASMGGFAITMTVQKRFRTDSMAAWILPALFVLGIALCAAVGWLTFIWASEIAAFLSTIGGSSTG